MSTLINRATGIADVAPKQGEKISSKKNPANIAARNAARDICLNCTRDVCNGCCGKSYRFTIAANRN